MPTIKLIRRTSGIEVEVQGNENESWDVVVDTLKEVSDYLDAEGPVGYQWAKRSGEEAAAEENGPPKRKRSPKEIYMIRKKLRAKKGG